MALHFRAAPEMDRGGARTDGAARNETNYRRGRRQRRHSLRAQIRRRHAGDGRVGAGVRRVLPTRRVHCVAGVRDQRAQRPVFAYQYAVLSRDRQSRLRLARHARGQRRQPDAERGRHYPAARRTCSLYRGGRHRAVHDHGLADRASGHPRFRSRGAGPLYHHEKERAVLRDQSKKTRQNVADHQRKFRGRPRGARLFQARQRARPVRRRG